MKLVPLCALLALVAPSVASAADARPAKPKFDINVPEYSLNTKVFDFPTGLRIMFQPDSSHEVVGVYMIINHGTKDDPEGKEETAHFVEHTWFRSKHGDLPPIMDVVQDLGADFNATTWNDLTDYRTVASSEFLPLLLRLESLRLTEPYKGVTEEEIDVEREVIRNEWRRRNEQDLALFFDFLYEAVYPVGHPYHDHSTHKSIDNIKLADLQKFMDDYYKPEHTTIMVVGDFDPDEAASLIFSYFDPKLLHPKLTDEMYFYAPRPGIEKPDQGNPEHWLTGAWDPDAWIASGGKDKVPFRFVERESPRISEQRPPVPPVGTTEVLTKKGPFDLKYVVVGWSLPGGYRSDHWDLQSVGQLAGQYLENGFYEELDNEQILDIGCLSQAEVENTIVACYAGIKDKKLDPLQIRDRMLDQLPEIWNPENFISGQTIGAAVSQTLFTRGKMEGIASLLMNLDLFAISFGSRAEMIAQSAHFNNQVQAHTDGFQKIMGTDLARISKLANEYLKRDRAATVILEPLDEDEIDIGSEHSSYDGASATDQVLRSSDDLKSVTAEQIAANYIKPSIEGLIDYELPSGLRVVVLPHGEAPTVQASLILPRDGVKEPEGLFTFVGSFADSVGHDPLPIAAQTSWFVNAGIPGLQQGVARPLWTDSWTDAVRLSVSAPSGNLDGALWLLREELETAHGLVDRKTDFIKDMRDQLELDWLTMDWHIAKATSEYLFPNHPFGTPMSWGDIDTMATWTNATVDQWLADHLRPEGATLVIVGNIDPDQGKKLAEQYFGGFKARKTAGPPPGKPAVAPMPTEPSKVLVFNEPSRTQTDVTLSCRLNYTDPSQNTAVSILGSLLRSKTFSQMRVTEGLAYSPGAYASINSDGSASLVFYSDGVVNSGTGRMFEFYNEAIKEVEGGTVSEDEVTLHKLRMARTEGVAAQSMGQMTGQITDLIRKGKDWEFFTGQGEIIAGVGKQQLVELIKGCADHSVTTIVGPKDVVTPQLDEMGVKYEVVEWRGDADDLLWQHDPKEAKKREKDRQKADKKAQKDKKDKKE